MLCERPKHDLSHWRHEDGRVPLERENLNSVVRVTSAGKLKGTAFIVSVEGAARWWPYVITADHVVYGELERELAIEVPDPHRPGELSEPIPMPHWRQPLAGVDLALAPFPVERRVSFEPIRTNLFCPKGVTPPLGAIVYYAGVFAPANVPMARSGTLGAFGVPVKKRHETRLDRVYEYEGHLVDCRSYDGFSGSPCFIQTLYGSDLPVQNVVPPPMINGEPMPLRALVWTTPLVGLFTSHYSDEGHLDNAESVVSRYGVGVILGSDYIWEALMTDKAKQERQKWDEELEAANASGQPPLRNASANPPDAPNAEYERFEDLTRQLVNTPKPKD